jgi:16S rRNA (guanine527-N7)-methyltransferase
MKLFKRKEIAMLTDLRFEHYIRLLLEANKTINLTSITDPAEIRQKHFTDSLALLEDMAVPHGAHLLDVGSGAGFPGVPLAIARPDLCITLLDGTAKKARFLEALAEELKLPLRVVCVRAEEAAHTPALREQFDLVVSRAVAALPLLCELCLPFVKLGGTFVSYKGTAEKAHEELAAAKQGIILLGGTVTQVQTQALSYGERTRIFIAKKSETPSIYPRTHGAMRKKPL